MPVINVHMTIEDGGLTREQKENLVAKLTDGFVEVVGRGKKSCVVIINEVNTDNYAIGGKSITNIRTESKDQETKFTIL
ncbi:MAG: 2-hydroxymuconate tautomerase family protein [Wolinella sp.]